MSNERIDVLAVTLPEPVGYRWILDTGEVRFNDDANYPPCDAYEEWSVCAAMFDADQVRSVASEEVEKVRAAVAELIEAAIDAHDFAANTARNEGRELDRRFYRLRAALARFEVK